MKKLILLLFTVSCSLFTAHCFAQDQHLIDSLTTKLTKLYAEKKELRNNVASMNDTVIAKILESLFSSYKGNNPDKEMEYASQELSLSEQIGYKQGIAYAYSDMGVINQNKGDLVKAMDYNEKALKLRLEIGDKRGIAGGYNNIGNIYYFQGKYPEALKKYFMSLKIREEIGNKKGMASSYLNIGNIYIRQGNKTEALKNFFSALKLSEELKDSIVIALSNNNIGNIYAEQGNYPQALSYISIGLKIREKLGIKHDIAASVMNIACIYKLQDNEAEAVKTFLASLKIYEEIGDKQSIAEVYINLADIYRQQKKYKESDECLNKVLSVAKEIRSVEFLKYSYNGLELLDSIKGNYKQALEDYKLFITYRDSLLNNENTKKTVALQMNYDFNKKQAADSIKAEEAKKVISAELKQEQTKGYAMYGGLALLLVFGGVMFNRFKVTQKQNKIIERQKDTVEKQKGRSDALLLNILPAEVAEELKEKGRAIAKQFAEVSVLFTDFKGFTNISEKMSAEELVAELHYCFSAFDKITQKFGLEKIKTIGDSYMAVAGLPRVSEENAVDAVKAGIAIRNFMKKYNQEKQAEGKETFEIRIGIHSGPVVAGIVGVKKFAYDIWGDTVNTASRMESSGEIGKVNISGSTYELVKQYFNGEHRGKIQAKNKGEIDMYFVEKAS